MKKFLKGTILFVICFTIISAVHIIAWYRFIPPVSAGYVCRDIVTNLSTDLEGASRKWFASYMSELKDWKVPYSYRIRRAKLDDVELLKDSCVQLEYTIWPSGANQDVMANLRLVGTRTRYQYKGQIVLRWSMENDRLTIVETMSPVQYQIQTPEFQEEIRQPQTEHYEMAEGEPETYYIRDGVLYVTYDFGEHLKEVPGGYEGVCAMINGLYNELLPYNSYIISKEFTAFVDYSGETAVLLYSTDAGETWQRSNIANGYPANTFLSKTADACFATFAVDRALGSDIYVTYKSTDFEKWERVTSPESVWSNLECVFWADDMTGYYARGENAFSMTADGGTNFQSLQISVRRKSWIQSGLTRMTLWRRCIWKMKLFTRS